MIPPASKHYQEQQQEQKKDEGGYLVMIDNDRCFTENIAGSDNVTMPQEHRERFQRWSVSPLASSDT